MYEGILNLNRVVNNYTLDHTLTEAVDCALVKSHTTDNPSHKQLVYCVRKQSLKKEGEQALFMFVKNAKENRGGLFPRLIELIQTQSNYYMIFEEANLLVDAALSQMYRHQSVMATRDIVVATMFQICEYVHLLLETKEFVVSGERVCIIPHFLKQPGGYKLQNRKLFMNLAYMVYFGANGEEESINDRYAKWLALEKQYYERKDFLSILTKYAQQNGNSGGGRTNTEGSIGTRALYPNLGSPSDLPQHNAPSQTQWGTHKGQPTQIISKPHLTETANSIQQPADDEFDSSLINIGVNPKIKQLASQVRESRKSQIRPGQAQDAPNIEELGIHIEPQQPHQNINGMRNPAPHKEFERKLDNPSKQSTSDNKANPNSKQNLPKSTQQAPVQVTNLFSKTKSIRYDQSVKPSPNISQTHPQNDNPFSVPQRNSNLNTVYLKKEPGKDETDQIFNTIFSSFMGPSKKSEGAFKSFTSKTITCSKDMKGSDQLSSAADEFDMLFKAYMSQFDLLHAVLKSFLTYYQGTNMGLVASYLIARCSVHRKLRLMDALLAEVDLFDCGESIYKHINKNKYVKIIEGCLYKDDPIRIKQAINFNMVLPETREIMQPYLGDIDPTDRTEEMTFYYLYCLSKRSHNKDTHNMLLHDCMYVLLHTNNEFVYDYSQIPKQWQEGYVNDRKKTIELLMFKIN